MSRADRTRCGRVQPLLALAASQDLGERASRRVWSHLAGCMSCRRRYADYLELRSALADFEPRPARPAGVGAEFFARLRRDILSGVAAAPPRARRAWVGAAAAAVLFLAGALAFQTWRPSTDGLLHRQPIAPSPPHGDFGTQMMPLAYPQGLGARRQLDLLFEEEAGLEVTPAGYGGLSKRQQR